MSDKEFNVFVWLAVVDLVVVVVATAVWTIVFWDSTWLEFNMILPLLIGALFMIPAMFFIMWKMIKR